MKIQLKDADGDNLYPDCGLIRKTLWSGSAMTKQDVPLSEDYTNFDYLILTYGTNAETFCTVARVPLILGTIQTSYSHFSSEGLNSDYAYKAVHTVKFPTTKTFSTVSSYNNVNLQLHLRMIEGVKLP